MTLKQLNSIIQNTLKHYSFQSEIMADSIDIIKNHHRLVRFYPDGKVKYFDPITIRVNFGRPMIGRVLNLITKIKLQIDQYNQQNANKN